MPDSSAGPLGGLALIGLLLLPVAATAQRPADRLRAAALRDLHGPDGTGHDGPLAKAGGTLLMLYHEYEAFRARDVDTTFASRLTDVRVAEGRVGIEAVAATTTEDLLADLKALGLHDAVTAGRVVSGWVPIDQIPDMARLESLRGLLQAEARPREQASPSRSADRDASPAASPTPGPQELAD